MPGLFSRLRGNRDGAPKVKSKKGANNLFAEQQPAKARWDDAFTRTTVEPEEIHELVKRCTEELKARGMTSISLVLQYPSAIYLLQASRCTQLTVCLPCSS
jgi:hypothetical protein